MERPEGLEAYARSIRFRLVGPDSRIPGRSWVGAVRRLRKVGVDPEVWNTVLPDPEERWIGRLIGLGGVPKMSTFAIGAVVARGVREMPAGSGYLNVGVWHGYTLLAGMAGGPGRTCVGVDDFSEHGGPEAEFRERFTAAATDAHHFHRTGFRRYLDEVHRGPLGLYYYDGPNSYEDELDALRMAEPYLVEGSYVLLDDTNWPERRRAARDFVSGSPHAYDVVFDQRTAYNKHLTFWNGLTILKRR